MPQQQNGAIPEPLLQRGYCMHVMEVFSLKNEKFSF